MFSPPDYSSLETFLNPTFGPWTVPIYLHRKPILDAVHAAAPFLRGVLLDVGCGNKPYASVLTCAQYVGIDVASSPHEISKFDEIYDGSNFPFDDIAFDSVLCTEVLEHSREPWLVMQEIARVLKPNGHALISAPMFIHHHEEPYDFQRFTKYGMEEVASHAGFEVLWIRPRGGAYVTALAAIYLALNQTLSCRPLIDICLWLMWPVAATVLWVESLLTKPPVISLGWQMLLRKTGASG